MRKHWDIKLVTTTKEETIWCENRTINNKILSENVVARKMRKTQILLNKPVYLGLSILELSKILMYEFWYYVKSKYSKNCIIGIEFHCINKSR